LTVADEILDGQSQLQQTQGIRYGSAALTHFRGDVVLFQLKLLDELRVPLRLFHRIEIFALKILYKRELKDSTVISIADNDRDFGQTKQLGGAPAAFSSDKFEVAVLFPDNQGLDDALFFDRVGEFPQGIGGELFTRLKRARADASQRNALDAFASVERGCGYKSRCCCRWGWSGRFCDGATAQ
jgi:hypothetical protein